MTINVDVQARKLEPIESLLRRFRKRCLKEGIVEKWCDAVTYWSNREKKDRKQKRHQAAERRRARKVGRAV